MSFAEVSAEIFRSVDVADQTGLLRHPADLLINDTIIKAAVLPNGKRLILQASFLRALDRSPNPPSGSGGLSNLDGLPFFLQADQLKPFISEGLRSSTTPIVFRLKSGRRTVGYDANLLAMVCEVYLKLRDFAKGTELKRYSDIIKACDILMRGLARVGIVALVDEATGYQEVRGARLTFWLASPYHNSCPPPGKTFLISN